MPFRAEFPHFRRRCQWFRGGDGALFYRAGAIRRRDAATLSERLPRIGSGADLFERVAEDDGDGLVPLQVERLAALVEVRVGVQSRRVLLGPVLHQGGAV